MKAPGAALIALVTVGALSCSGARHRRIVGPPPEYEPPPSADEAWRGTEDAGPRNAAPAPDAAPP